MVLECVDDKEMVKIVDKLNLRTESAIFHLSL